MEEGKPVRQRNKTRIRNGERKEGEKLGIRRRKIKKQEKENSYGLDMDDEMGRRKDWK